MYESKIFKEAKEKVRICLDGGKGFPLEAHFYST